MPDRNLPYDVFISYSRKDRQVALRLRRLFESFRLPEYSDTARTPLKVWRDLEDIVGSDLDTALADAVAGSRKLLVICSEAARRSRDVAKEIRTFVDVRGARNIVLTIVSGRPNEEVKETDAEQDQAFPEILLTYLTRPLAADLRWNVDVGWFENLRHRREARLQILADLLELPREKVFARARAQFRRRAAITGVAVMAAVAALTGYAVDRRIENRISNIAADSLSASASPDALRLALESSRIHRLAHRGIHPQAATALRAAVFRAGGYRISSAGFEAANAISAYAVGGSGTIYGARLWRDREKPPFLTRLELWRWNMTALRGERVYQAVVDGADDLSPVASIIASKTEPETVVVVLDNRSGLFYFGPDALRGQHAPLSTPKTDIRRDVQYYTQEWVDTPSPVFLQRPQQVLDGRTLWNFDAQLPRATSVLNAEFRTVSRDGRLIVACNGAELFLYEVGPHAIALPTSGRRVLDNAEPSQPLACSSLPYPDRREHRLTSVHEAISPDGKWLLALLSNPSERGYFLTRIGEGAPRLLPSRWGLANPNFPSVTSGFSEDSRWLVVGDEADGSTALWDLRQPANPTERFAELANQTQNVPLRGLPLHAFASTRTGDRLALWVGDRLVILDTSGAGAPRALRHLTVQFPSHDLSHVQFSEDGRWLLVHRRGYDPLVFDLRIDSAGTVAVVRVSNDLDVNMASLTDDGSWLIVAAVDRKTSSNLEMRAFPLRESSYAPVAQRVLDSLK